MGTATGVNKAKAIFACGCFWSKEYFFSRLPGIMHTRVGFTGGHTTQPTYHEVCGKQTGHAEAVEVTFDPQEISFERLARFFFEIHDPTVDRSDKGGQYRSAIFYQNQEQYDIAHALIQQLQQLGYSVATTLEAATEFWEAEARHQQYCDVRGQKPRLHQVKRFDLPAA
jgi:peptide methionine sulfoxide reductase msrA/msrB